MAATPSRSSPRKKKGKKNQKATTKNDNLATPKPAKTSTAPKTTKTSATPQPTETSKINNEPTPKASESAPKKGFPRWSVEEDKKLCIAWLNTSRDAIVGKGQKASTFWEQIHGNLSELITKYNQEKKNAKGFKELPIRPVGAVECRWALILKLVNKFLGCYSNVERRMKSGKTRKDTVHSLSSCLYLFILTYKTFGTAYQGQRTIQDNIRNVFQPRPLLGNLERHPKMAGCSARE
jgi:hypothetical protein